jgi:hypothetical protein
MKMKKPKPAVPTGHVVAHIYKPSYDNRRAKVIKYDIDAPYGHAIQFIPSDVKPPPFHCVPGKNLNWSPTTGFAITDVQAIAICGAQPNPLNPVYINNRARCLRGSLGLDVTAWEPKYWVQDLDPKVEVTCNKCLALMRARLRVKIQYTPAFQEAFDAGHWKPAKAKRSKPRNEMCYARHDGSSMVPITDTRADFLAPDDDPDA